MKFFAEAYDKDNVLKSFELDLPDRDAVIDFLKRHELTPISVKAGRERRLILSKVTTVDKVVMSRHLFIMLKAGLPITDAFDLLNQNTTNIRLKKFYGEAITALEDGKPISTVFRKHPEIFDPIYLGSVEVGEASGSLDKSFFILARELEKRLALDRKVKGALIYPAILFGAIISLVFLIIAFVIPRIVGIFETADFELPTISKVLFKLSELANLNLVFAAVVYFAIPVLLAFGIASRPGRALVLRIAARLPKISKLVEGVELARISRSLQTMLNAGMPILNAIGITANSMVGTKYEKILYGISEEVRKGVSLTAAMKKKKRDFPPVFYGIISVGEKSGTIDEVLDYLASFYEDEVDSSVTALTSIIEPVMLVIIALIVLLLAVSTLVPIYSLISNLQ